MLLTTVLIMLSTKAVAWDNHQAIMEQLFETRTAKKRIYRYWKIRVPCPEAEKAELETLAKTLSIDASKVPVFSATRCKKGEKNTEVLLEDMLTGSMIDEPDQGMDQNLPESADPKHYRNWMGGTTGPTSQGFRHMYFAGMELSSPVKTFQIPLSAIGDAISRIRILRQLSTDYFNRGELFWGTRTLLWELHYIQDIHQPFHVLEIPSFRFFPWKKIFSHFIQSTTHSIANYHYAYEGLALEWVKDPRSSNFTDCMELQFEGGQLGEPSDLVFFPRNAGGDLGPELYRFLGPSLKESEVDLPNGIGAPDYFALTHMNEPSVLNEEELKNMSHDEIVANERARAKWQSMNQIKQITCDLMKSVSRFTWNELDRSYLPPLGSPESKSTSNNTGK